MDSSWAPDDYMIKPFHLRELLLSGADARTRRPGSPTRSIPSRTIAIAGYRMDLEMLRGEGPRGPLQLTALEADLLETLTSQPKDPRAVRGELLEKVWGYHSEVETRTVDNFIARLRKYLKRSRTAAFHEFAG